MILDVDTRAIGRDGWFWCADNNFTGLILIEVVVVLAVAQRVFRSVEVFSNIRSNWTWACTRWSLQMIGLRVEEQDEWTAVITEQQSVTVSPISGYETSLDDTIQ